MEYSELAQVIDTAVEFPITHDTLVEQLDGMEVTAPVGGSVPVCEVLDRAGEPTYQSAEMLYMTIVGNLDETFVGRKYSDGRGGAYKCPDPRCGPRRSL